MIGDIADRTPGADKDAILHAVGADLGLGLGLGLGCKMASL